MQIPARITVLDITLEFPRPSGTAIDEDGFLSKVQTAGLRAASGSAAKAGKEPDRVTANRAPRKEPVNLVRL